jgi:Zn-dependent protease
MLPDKQKSIHLFRFSGINVYLHWSWFLVAIYQINGSDRGVYDSPIWPVLEYLALFLIVLLHEFGHSLACRQVGGKADQIVLWPFGGVAFVAPPQRPGATLWSIAAGPLVNVILTPIITVLYLFGHYQQGTYSHHDLYAFIGRVWFINISLLVFNMLPIYPLDGGQILRSLLWFVFGRVKSLTIASIVGFIGIGGLLLLAIYSWQESQSNAIWIGLLSFFVFMHCRAGFLHARALSKLAKLPRHEEYTCPDCSSHPLKGSFWKCGQCGNAFDTFVSQAHCPHCGNQFPNTTCVDCGSKNPYDSWIKGPSLSPRNE